MLVLPVSGVKGVFFDQNLPKNHHGKKFGQIFTIFLRNFHFQLFKTFKTIEKQRKTRLLFSNDFLDIFSQLSLYWVGCEEIDRPNRRSI